MEPSALWCRQLELLSPEIGDLVLKAAIYSFCSEGNRSLRSDLRELSIDLGSVNGEDGEVRGSRAGLCPVRDPCLGHTAEHGTGAAAIQEFVQVLPTAPAGLPSAQNGT
ncbi:hypothetical protein TURU_137729 [Turdus rufiventris]|nr:hypothetical protein TURU_137729 [Turdus rufiventris]